MKKAFTLFSPILLTITFTHVFAGPERISWPENYAAHFIRYQSVDKPAGDKPAKTRVMYVNRQAFAQAKAEQPLPEGTILIMEDRTVELDDDGNPRTDSQGRFIPTNEIIAVIIQQKQAGWGELYPEALRNGDWEYAVFKPNGTLKENVEYEKCFACHKGQAAQDYNFTFTPFLSSVNK